MLDVLNFMDIKPGQRVTGLVPNGRNRDGDIDWKEVSGVAFIVNVDSVVCRRAGRDMPVVFDDHTYVSHGTRRPR